MKDTFFGCKVLVEKFINFKEQHELTYQQISDDLGVDKSYINRIVKLKCFPSLPFLNKLAQFMNVPLYSLFMPSDELLSKEFMAIVKDKMKKLKITTEELGEKTNISPLHLMDLLEGYSVITKKERIAITTILEINESNVYHDEKMNLLENLILELDLKSNQKENVLKYIKDNIE